MSKISLAPDASGTGIFTIASPNSNTNRTLTLPDDTGTIVTNSGNQAGSFTTLNTSGAVVFNDAGADVDFRVEGDTEANLLFVDAGADKVGIGTNTFNTNGGVLQVSNGISFPASQSALTDPNTLDDYEEGTWTPVLGGADAPTGQTYTIQNGRYTKTGNLVNVEFSVQLSNAGTMTGGSGFYLRGLPFSAASISNDYIGGGIISQAENLGANLIAMWFSAVNANSFAYIGGSGAAATTVANSLSRSTYLTNTTRITGSMTYRAA